ELLGEDPLLARPVSRGEVGGDGDDRARRRAFAHQAAQDARHLERGLEGIRRGSRAEAVRARRLASEPGDAAPEREEPDDRDAPHRGFGLPLFALLVLGPGDLFARRWVERRGFARVVLPLSLPRAVTLDRRISSHARPPRRARGEAAHPWRP